MKILKKIFAILFISIVTISCNNNDDNSETPTPTANYFLKAKIDGVQYETDAAFRVLSTDDNDRITITSVLSDNRNFKLQGPVQSNIKFPGTCSIAI